MIVIRDHPFKTSACHRGGGVSPCADGLKPTVHMDQKSTSYAFFWNADGRGVGVRNFVIEGVACQPVGVKNHKNLPMDCTKKLPTVGG